MWYWIIGGAVALYLLSKPSPAPGAPPPAMSPSGRMMSTDEVTMFTLISNALMDAIAVGGCAANLMDVAIGGGYTTVSFIMPNNQTGQVARPTSAATSAGIMDEAKAFATSICQGG